MSTDLTPLVEVLRAVKPYLLDIVLVGGWVPIVYERCTSIYPTRTLRTADVDFACRPRLAVREDTMDHLLKGAGFRCELFGNTEAPLCRYINERELEIEFLTPLKGDGSAAVTKLQEGLTAEPLRYLDVLLDHVRPVKIDEDHVVWVPWISAFLFQKGLSVPHRVSALKKDKDLYYVFKIVQAVDRVSLMTELKEVFGAHPKKWRRTFIQNLQKAFRDEHSEGVGSVVGQLMQIPGEQDNRDILIMKVFTTMDDFIQELPSLV
jgi:hypothetical protein